MKAGNDIVKDEPTLSTNVAEVLSPCSLISVTEPPPYAVAVLIPALAMSYANLDEVSTANICPEPGEPMLGGTSL